MMEDAIKTGLPTIRLIMLNGPAGSGKDKFVEMYKDIARGGNVKHLKFASDLAIQTRRTYNIDKETWDRWYSSQELKNSFKQELGCSPRQAMIETSYWTKYYAGEDCYSKATAQRVEEAIRQGYRHILISDLGLQEELEYMCSYDFSNTIEKYYYLYFKTYLDVSEGSFWLSKELVTVSRAGHTFDGDNRVCTIGKDKFGNKLVDNWHIVNNVGNQSYSGEVGRVYRSWY